MNFYNIFGPYSIDCYFFNPFLDLFCFSISSLTVLYHLIFIPNLILILLIVICFVLKFWMIENFFCGFF